MRENRRLGVSAFKDFASDDEPIRCEIGPCGNDASSGRIQIPKQASTAPWICLRSPAPASAHFGRPWALREVHSHPFLLSPSRNLLADCGVATGTQQPLWHASRVRVACVLGGGAHVSGIDQETSHQSRIQKSRRRLPHGPVLRFSKRFTGLAKAARRQFGPGAAGAS
jgi:hypothetical protein